MTQSDIESADTPTRLSNGGQFPALEFAKVGGGTISLPSDLSGGYGVVLFYRGAWCPYCNAQLAAFQRAHDSLGAAGIAVVAISVDDESAAAALVSKRRLGFAVGYGADADQVAAATGAYVNADPKYLQSTGFVLAPDGTVVTAVYSSGAIGRLVPDDVIGLVRYIQSPG
ncbi:peroxiredoxin family protein [Antrihabitans cavernicola]|uniref:thioredoxin-dependent peroxiredoxin n=1 Tax=Antrihabitans cavernicola TaxID=2495913 RepID=A0A5A7S890_9NOCA|nr:peroxiredoxin family protein [Spelaeibacter cavernicola]KAA0021137.1 peroxiredoxin family protein [Spelaeibacter cavernicola]